jgi:hypothetical protein
MAAFLSLSKYGTFLDIVGKQSFALNYYSIFNCQGRREKGFREDFLSGKVSPLGTLRERENAKEEKEECLN